MEKDFDGWNSVKKILHNESHTLDYQEREVWWCSLGINIGSEQDGKNRFYERPVLVYRKFNQKMFWAMPITSNIKDDQFHEVVYFKNKESTVIISQLRLVSTRRLLRKISVISNTQYKRVKDKMSELI